jgi:hypothetical protein
MRALALANGKGNSMQNHVTSFPNPTDNPVPYPEIRSTLQTGDLLFFAGSSPLDYMIEALDLAGGDAPYSHVGMVIRDGENLYFWDAPGGGTTFPDPYTANPANRLYTNGQQIAHDGCRVAPLDELLAYYVTVEGTHFWLRHLKPALTSDQLAALTIFINRHDGLPFPMPVETKLPENYTAGQAGTTFFFGTYFCAQLVADSYLHMGLLSADKWPANSYNPGALASSDPNKLPLVKPATLSQTIDVVWVPPTTT